VIYSLWRFLAVDPIVRKELYGVSRRWTTYLGRSLYVGLMGLVIWLMWPVTSRVSGIDYTQLARLGQQAFYVFIAAQTVLVILAAAVQSSDMISKEVRANTLGVLFMTPLRPLQIVWGKWKSCMGILLLMILSGIPVFAVPVYLGGVASREFLVVLALTLVTAGFAVAFSLLISTFFKRGTAGLVLSIIGYLAYAFVPLVILLVLGFRDREYSTLLMIQNPVAMLIGFLAGGNASLPILDALGVDLWIVSCVFNVLMILALLMLTARRLRKLAQVDPRPPFFKRMFEGLDRAFRMRNILGKELIRSRSDVWQEHPYLWKELHTRMTGKFRYVTRTCLALLLLLVIGMVAFSHNLTSPDTGFVPVMFMIVLMIFWAIGAGAGTVAKEREEKKWEVLMTLPLNNAGFVMSKLAGALVSLVPLGVLMLLFLFLPLLVWHSLVSFLPVYLATMVFGVFLVVLGMYISTYCSTSRKAFAITLSAATAILAGIPLFISFIQISFHANLLGDREAGYWILQATNPFLWLEQITSRNYYYYSREFPVSALAAFCVLYLGLSLGMLVTMVNRFDMIRCKA
jgi:ABC-type transport system involved in multi-copper enzyme maturation permease subunit